MTSHDPDRGLDPSLRLVSSRSDFLVIYLASLGGMIAIFLMTYVVQGNGVPLLEYALAFPVACVLALAPPVLGMFMPANRTLVQVLYGLALVPVVGAIVVSAMQFLRAL